MCWKHLTDTRDIGTPRLKQSTHAKEMQQETFIAAFTHRRGRRCTECGEHCRSSCTLYKAQITRRYAQRAQISADPEDPDFGLWTPGSEA